MSAPSRPVDPALAALSLPTPASPSATGPSPSDSDEPFGDVLAAECADSTSPDVETPEESEEAGSTATADQSLLAQALAPYLFAPARFDLRNPASLEVTLPEGEVEEGIQKVDTDEEEAEGFFAQAGETEISSTTLSAGEGVSIKTVGTAYAAVASSVRRLADVAAASSADGAPELKGLDLAPAAQSDPINASLIPADRPPHPVALAPAGGALVSNNHVAQAATPETALAQKESVPAGSEKAALAASQGVEVASTAKNAEVPVREGKAERSGVKPLFSEKKDKFLNIDKEVFAKVSRLVGTDAANQGETSMSPLRSHSLEPLARAADLSAGASQTADAVDETQASLATRAVAVVEDIREISAGLNAHRRHVDLNFDFGGQDRLSVRVEVRNGEIQTQFRTDSTELRDALQQAWNSQGLQQEGRARLSEPVFLPAASRDSQSNQSFADAQTRQQRQSEAPVFSSLGARGVSSAPAIAPLVSSSPVVASDRQLHVFA